MDTEYPELADSFFFYIIKYMSEETEINLKAQIGDYITTVNRAIELKLATDRDHYSGVILYYLKERNYFEPSPKTQNKEMYRLTENGKTHFRRIKETEQIINPGFKFFMPPNSDPETDEKQWNLLNKQSNPNSPDKYTNRIYSVIFKFNKNKVKETVDEPFSENNIPIIAIIESDTTYDIYTLRQKPSDMSYEIKKNPIHKGYAVEIVYFEK